MSSYSGSTCLKELKETGSDVQGIYQNQDLSANDLAESAFAEWNPIYSTPARQSVLVAVNPCYGVLDVKTKETNYSSSNPVCETPDAKQEQVNSQPDPGYEGIVVVKGREENVDNEKKEMNESDSQFHNGDENINIKRGFYQEIGHKTADSEKDKPEDTNPDEKIEAKNIKSEEVDGTNSYDKADYKNPDVQKDGIDDTGSESTHSKPDKKGETSAIKLRQNSNPYDEPGYETLDLKREKIDDSSLDTTYVKLKNQGSGAKIKAGESIDPDPYEEPGYATTDFDKKEINNSSSGATYAKPDKEKKGVERQDHSASDKGIKTDEQNAGHSTPDIKRIEINGDLYALPDKSKNSQKVRTETFRLKFMLARLTAGTSFVIE